MSALPDAWCHKHLSLADKTNFLKPQAQEVFSHRHVPDLCLASDLELPELPCAGSTPEVTAKLFITYSSQDFRPSKLHLGNPALRVLLNYSWAFRKPPGTTMPY